jgi:hypothetical protein
MGENIGRKFAQSGHPAKYPRLNFSRSWQVLRRSNDIRLGTLPGLCVGYIIILLKLEKAASNFLQILLENVFLTVKHQITKFG